MKEPKYLDKHFTKMTSKEHVKIQHHYAIGKRDNRPPSPHTVPMARIKKTDHTKFY